VGAECHSALRLAEQGSALADRCSAPFLKPPLKDTHEKKALSGAAVGGSTGLALFQQW
jgi:hypothetical protein